MDSAIYLAFYNAADSRILAELTRDADATELYLPEEVNEEIALLHTPPSSSCYVKLGIEACFVLLSVYGKDCCTLLLKGKEMPIPLSSTDRERVVLLRADDQFFTPAGRWSVLWEDENGSISNSMRPPPLPIEPSTEDLGSGLGEGNRNPDGDDRVLCDTSRLSRPKEYPNDTSEVTVAPHLQDSNTSSDSHEPGHLAEQTVISIEYGPDTESEDVRNQNPAQRQSQSPLVTEKHTIENQTSATSENYDGQAIDKSQVAPKPLESKLLSSDDEQSRSPSRLSRSESTDRDHLFPLRDVDMNVANGNRPGQIKKTRIPKFTETEESNIAESKERKSKSTKRKRGTPSNWSRKRPKSARTKLLESDSSVDHDTRMNDETSVSKSVQTVPRTSKVDSREQDNFGISGRGRRNSIGSATTSPALRTRSHDIASSTPTTSASVESPSRKCDGLEPVVFFGSNTTIQDSAKVMRTFDRLGGRKASSIATANMFCIASDHLKKTSNLLIALVQGMDIVTEDWLTETHQHGYFLGPTEFVPHDSQKEQEWRFCLRDAINKGKSKTMHLLAGVTVYFSPQLKQDLGTRYRELASVAEALGADTVKYRLPAAANIQPKKVLFLGVENDPHTAEVYRLGARLHNKDILVMAVLRGYLEWNSEEFLLEVPVKEEE